MAEEPHPSGLSPAELWNRYQRYPSVLAKLLTFTFIVAIVYVLFSAVEAVLVPVLTALLIAYLLDPLVDWFEERGWSRSSTILGLLAVGAGGIMAFLLFLYPTVSHQAHIVANGFPSLVQRLETDLLPWAASTFNFDVPDSWSAALSTYGDTLQAQVPSLTRAASGAFGQVWMRVTILLASAINIVMIPVFTFYFLRDFDRMRLAVVDYLPEANRELILDRIVKMDEVVGAWFRGQVEVALILAGLYAVGLGAVFGWSGIGVGAGLAIGLLAGVLNIVPYFGFVIGFTLSVLMVLLDWSGIGPLIAVLAVFGVVQGLEGYVITPRIVGEKVGLRPVTVIIALLLGGEILGLVGILLALPIAGIIRVLWPDVVRWYKSSTVYLGDDHPVVRDSPTVAGKEEGSSPS